jgi:hypothetical protein
MDKKYKMVSLRIIVEAGDEDWAEKELMSSDIAQFGLMCFGASSRDATEEEINELYRQNNAEQIFNVFEEKKLAGGLCGYV